MAKNRGLNRSRIDTLIAMKALDARAKKIKKNKSFI